MKKNILIILALSMLVGSSAQAQNAFKSQEECAKSDVCYCSVKCGFRKKNSTDNPVYVANDPNGKYCYCKPWDRDNYNKKRTDGTSCADDERAKAYLGEK